MFVEVNDEESDASGENMTSSGIENKLSLEMGREVSETVTVKSNGAITANDPVSVTHTTNIISDTGRTVFVF